MPLKNRLVRGLRGSAHGKLYRLEQFLPAAEGAALGFYRSIPLAEGVDVNAARASMNDDVLEIRIPTPDQARGRRIEIGEREAPTRKSA